MFSEVVESVMVRTGRVTAADRTNIVDFVNSTVRECQTVDGLMFHRDFVEGRTTITADPTIWTMPSDFRLMRTVRYPDGSYPPFQLPGKVLFDMAQYYYSAGTYLTMVGCGTSGQMAYGYYRWLPRLKYYPEAERPAVYDEAADSWTYLNDITDPDAQEIARARVSNWLLLNHTELIKEGATAKMCKLVKDGERAVQAYSLYKQMQDAMKRSEAFETLGK